jgi:ATPase subunit of ABC transporter with duplicated ATPase domains
MMTQAQDDWYAAGGPDADKRVANVLTGLGFKQEQWNKACAEFSGGWQVRRLAATGPQPAWLAAGRGG